MRVGSALFKGITAFIFSFYLNLAFAWSIYASGFVVIANPSSAAQLDRETIRSFMLGWKDTLPDGTPVEIVIPKEDGKKFVEKFLGVRYNEFKVHWLTKALAGDQILFRELETEKIPEFVRRNRGAIGVLPADKIPEDVKVILKVE